MIPSLPQSPVGFPDPETALTDPDGLLAAGGALTPEWLLTAYYHGIFPWYSEPDPILWWSPNPRWTLDPEHLRINRSLRKQLRKAPFQLRANQCFEQVIDACAAPRAGQPGTWITKEIAQAYLQMHRLGYAHSIEVFQEGDLVGGLYGICLGNVFFGESMFSRTANASKFALVALAGLPDIALIDCQTHSPHTEAMGAQAISRADFRQRVQALVPLPLSPTSKLFTDEDSLNRATSL